ncbi:hypothetical protein L5515_017086 [Caenorhabditis briggsae]|uniref:Uncharacterized protein n=1 Tax=Caenorhabditis briggsae TaxID=6238 RepID=A0AAE9FD90_CAEBR|nr:hypothetical protein L5515_017086 [Caenorhabditis briggsae]
MLIHRLLFPLDDQIREEGDLVEELAEVYQFVMFIIQRPECDGGRPIVVAASDYFTSFSSLQVPWQHVLKDNNNCATSRCMWQGIGKQCKSPKHMDDYGPYFDFINKDEKDEDLLNRLKLRHSINTFIIMNNGQLGDVCKRRRLWCNVAYQHISENAYEEFFEYLMNPEIPTAIRTKFYYKVIV